MGTAAVIAVIAVLRICKTAITVETAKTATALLCRGFYRVDKQRISGR